MIQATPDHAALINDGVMLVKPNRAMYAQSLRILESSAWSRNLVTLTLTLTLALALALALTLTRTLTLRSTTRAAAGRSRRRSTSRRTTRSRA